MSNDYVMVPREPTPEMRRAGVALHQKHTGHLSEVITSVYRAMIAAAPPAASAPSAEQCYCDRMGIGVPGVSCGDCPTRDYKPAVPAPVVPLTDEQFADMVAEASLTVDLAASPIKLLAFARAVLSAAPVVREPLTNEQVLPAFDAWKERYGLRYEPNWSKETETDCLAAFEAGIAAGQLALLSRTVVKRKPLTNAQIIDATVQIDCSENGYVIRLARAIEQAHGIGTTGGGND